MCNILVVENNPRLRLLYLEELRREGHNVLGVSRGEQAEEALKYMPIELIILDLSLSERNGLDFLQEILKEHPNVKVIINTAYPNYKLDFRSWGADRFIIKSSGFAELKNAINEVVAESPPAKAVLRRSHQRKKRLEPAHT